jgi:hypothetical protein
MFLNLPQAAIRFCVKTGTKMKSPVSVGKSEPIANCFGFASAFFWYVGFL